jgi:hypothetical protein
VHPSSKFPIDLFQFPLKSLAHRLSEHGELAVSRLGADMREAEKVERLGFSSSTHCSIRRRKTTEFEHPCLSAMQFQAEPCEPLAQLDKEPLGFEAMLESHDKVVSKTDDHYVSLRSFPSPLVDPEVE